MEGNPALAQRIKDEFCDDVDMGRLIVVNKAIAVEGAGRRVPFYLHKRNAVLSQLAPPSLSTAVDFEEIEIESISIGELTEQFGSPYYVKIDLEGLDADILCSMFETGVFPSYVSAEIHDIRVYCALVLSGGYNAFKLASPKSTGEPNGLCFAADCAGPFGPDLGGAWMTAENFLRLLGVNGVGWKDVHASRVDVADPTVRLRLRELFISAAFEKVRNLRHKWFGR